MTILILDQFSDLGGAQLCLTDLVPAMLLEGWNVHVAAPQGPLLEKLRQHGATVHTLAIGDYSHGRKGLVEITQFSARLPGLVRRIRKLAAQVSPHLIYVNGPRLLPVVALARLGCATVFHSHNRISSAPQRILARAAIAKCGASVIAASSYAAAQWRSAHVVYSGVDGPALTHPRIQRSPCIGMIGRISPQKRQKEFVLACARLSLDRSDVRFVLSGDVLFGDRRGQSYKRELQGLFPPSLQFLGWTDDVYSVLAELDLLVVPSSGEGGFPRVAMEAFAAGVPVLAHASGAIPEVLVDGQTGFLMKCGSAEEIATRVNELVADRDTLQRVGIAAHRIWRERFTSTLYGKQVCKLLRDLIYRS